MATSITKLPLSPSLAHTNTTNGQWDRPSTPPRPGFISPVETPLGSPSKKQLPPGAHDLPDAFESALKLVPTAGNPTRATMHQQTTTSPTKLRSPLTEDTANDVRSSVLYAEKWAGLPGSPTAKSGKENTPPPHKLAKENTYSNQAAASRLDLYKPRDQVDTANRSLQRGLPPDALEKLSKPAVRRLANVTQLCKSCDYI